IWKQKTAWTLTASHWIFGKFRQIGVHVVPWLRARRPDVRHWLEPARVVEAHRFDRHHAPAGGIIGKKRRAALGAETPPRHAPARRRDRMILGLTLHDLNGRRRNEHSRRIAGAARALAVAAMAVAHQHRFG